MKSNNIFKSFAALVLGCALLVNSCQGTKEESENKKPVEPVFPAMVEEYNVVHGSTLTLNFEVNMDWTLTISDSNMRWFWIEDNSFKVDKISGKVATNGVPESVTVHIGVSDTEEFDNNRECTLTLTMGGKSQDVAKYMRPAKSRTIAVKVAKVENGAFVKDASGAYVYEETEAQTMTLLWSEEDADFRMPVEVNANFEWTVSAPEWLKFQEPDKKQSTGMQSRQKAGGDDILVIDAKNVRGIDYKMARCCNPIYGDDVFGFVTRTEGIKIHRMTCPNAARLLDTYPYRIQKVKWSESPSISNFQTGLRVTTALEPYVINEIMDIVNSFRASIRMFNVAENERQSTYEISMKIAVPSNLELDKVISQIRNLRNVIKITRM